MTTLQVDVEILSVTRVEHPQRREGQELSGECLSCPSLLKAEMFHRRWLWILLLYSFCYTSDLFSFSINSTLSSYLGTHQNPIWACSHGLEFILPNNFTSSSTFKLPPQEMTSLQAQDAKTKRGLLPTLCALLPSVHSGDGALELTQICLSSSCRAVEHWVLISCQVVVGFFVFEGRTALLDVLSIMHFSFIKTLQAWERFCTSRTKPSQTQLRIKAVCPGCG